MQSTSQRLSTLYRGRDCFSSVCPWNPRTYAGMDMLISDRKVTAGSGEWCRLKLVKGYKLNSSGQCIRATSIFAVHQ